MKRVFALTIALPHRMGEGKLSVTSFSVDVNLADDNFSSFVRKRHRLLHFMSWCRRMDA
jgi:hypothetical protein